MTDQERALRTKVILDMLTGFGIEDPKRAAAVVKLTGGIPWLVPPFPGEQPTRDLLFLPSISKAALASTYGAPNPGLIMEAAIELAGKVRSESGHMSERRWVKAARNPRHMFGMDEAEFEQLTAGYDTAGSITDGK